MWCLGNNKNQLCRLSYTLDIRRICRTVRFQPKDILNKVDKLNRYYMLVPSSDWRSMIQSMDLRRLCSTILEKTIADSDMYQNGRTKIFFRAGMLAALESLRSGRLNELAIVLQKNMRRRVAMKRYQQMRNAAIKIQTWWRGIMARRIAEEVRRETSAQRLQTGIRRYLQRRRYLEIVHSIALFQSRRCFLRRFVTYFK